jgi:hypothetical protein
MTEDLGDHLPGNIVTVYAEAYGFMSEPWGEPEEAVMSHFLTFVNHGCNGTANLGERDFDPNKYTEVNINLDMNLPEELTTTSNDVYDPHSDRDFAKHATSVLAWADIQAGDELFDNYISFGADEEDEFRTWVQSLRSICSGTPGLVERYQNSQGKGSYEDMWV